MVLLEGAEQVELERQPRMAGRHHRMGNELVAPGAAPVAIETDLRADSRPLERGHAVGDVRRMRPGAGIMDREPTPRRAVAGFAAHPVAGEKFRASAGIGDAGGVAAEARGRRSGIAEAQRGGDRPPPRAREHCERAAVRAAWRGRFLPARDLVLPNHRAIAFGPAVAGRSRAARDSQERAGALRDERG